jgi:hypothetical protein
LENNIDLPQWTSWDGFSRAMEFYEAPTLKYIGNDPIDEHGSFILGTSQEPCSHNITSGSPLLCAPCFR